ncbi:hypothetical protein E2C01_004210 [Portunus trituberculatus]|uniref:Uncharacterized protein n=1 Tax=Portunus trituberculatus TaxID=210409 RepID=A0A5B7CVR7_PORTR|nr:hypothetical protein [Portunus trituberculatus]
MTSSRGRHKPSRFESNRGELRQGGAGPAGCGVVVCGVGSVNVACGHRGCDAAAPVSETQAFIFVPVTLNYFHTLHTYNPATHRTATRYYRLRKIKVTLQEEEEEEEEEEERMTYLACCPVLVNSNRI